MAFVCTCAHDTVEAEFFRRGSSAVVVAAVGYDDASTKGYTAVVGLEPMAGGDFEFFFHILEVDSRTNEEHEFWCGKDVAEFISREDRKHILDTILALTCE